MAEHSLNEIALAAYKDRKDAALAMDKDRKDTALAAYKERKDSALAAYKDRKDTALATLTDRREVALAEYNQVVNQFRALTDIRFKLLTYLPLGTAFAAAWVSKDKSLVMQPAIAAFAFVVTLCIATYNKRNDQFYDELIARAAELERELDIEHGSFMYRPRPWLKYGPVPVEHRWPIDLIYAAAASLWAYLFVEAFGTDRSWLNAVPSWPIWLQPKLMWLELHLMWLKALVPIVGFGCWRGLLSIEKARGDEQREAVKSLMEQLLGSNVVALQVKQENLVEAIASEPILDVGENKAKRRVSYHWNQYEQKRDPRAASALLAAVLDLPARWIEDVWTGRR